MCFHKLFNDVRPSFEGPHSVLVLDISGSMSERDVKPNRLGAAKEAALEYLDEVFESRPETFASVIAYDNWAKVVCEPVMLGGGVESVRRAVQSLRPGSTTDIGRALNKTTKVLSRADAMAQAHVVLLTDGHHNGKSDPASVAGKLKERCSIRIDCIGIGANGGAVDEGLLREIASRDDNGQPRYHFIRDRFTLVEHFRNLAGYLSRT